MKTSSPYNENQPIIIRQTQHQHSGMSSHRTERHAIGYVVAGSMYLYDGDSRKRVSQDEIYYLGAGQHYIENIPPLDGEPFEQIIFFYTPEELINTLSLLNITYNVKIDNSHSCSKCRAENYVSDPAWNTLKCFFSSITNYSNEGLFNEDNAAEQIKRTELIYLISSHKNCCVKSKIFESADSQADSFEQIIYQNIFNDITIDKLAQLTNRSLTSFKKEFKDRFFNSPHNWLISQRLMHARLLLISTKKTIADIGTESGFPNTSHFIKLFKKEYEYTPAVYRSHHNKAKSAPKSSIQEKSAREFVEI